MDDDPDHRRNPPWLRFLLTLALCCVMPVAARVLLPGIDFEKWQHLGRLAERKFDSASVSIVALGLRPLLTGFVLTELFALLIPAWRKLRLDGTDGRRKLRRAALVVSFAVALLHGYFIGRWLQGVASRDPMVNIFTDELPPAYPLLIALTLASGTALLWVVAQLIDRMGMGGGLAIVAATELLLSVWNAASEGVLAVHSETLAPMAALMQLGAALLVIIGTVFFLRRSSSGSGSGDSDESAALQQPVTSLVPIYIASSLTMLPASLSSIGWLPAAWSEKLVIGSFAYHGATLLLIVAAGALCGWGFTRPTLKSMSTATTAQRSRAVLFAMIYLIALWTVWSLPPLFNVPSVSITLPLVVLSAVALDLHAEWIARKSPSLLVPIWIAPDVPAARMLCAQLDRFGIAAMTRGLYQRSLWRVFGPQYELTILVPISDGDRALSVLRGEELAPPAQAARSTPMPSALSLPGLNRRALLWSGLMVIVVAAGIGIAWRMHALRNRPVMRLVLVQTESSRGRNTGHALAEDVEVARLRLSHLGIQGAQVSTDGRHLLVDLRKLEPQQLEKVRSVLLRSGRLEFRSVDNNTPYMLKLGQYLEMQRAAFPGLEIGYDAWSNPTGSTQTDIYLKAADKSVIERALAALPAELALPAEREILFERTQRVTGEGELTSEIIYRTYLVDRTPALTGQSIANAEVAFDPQSRAEVAIIFDAQGATRFSDLTASRVGRKLAIVLEGTVMSAPVIMTRIGGGRARITLGHSDEDPRKLNDEAQQLAAILRAHEMPVPLEIFVEQALVPGRDTP